MFAFQDSRGVVDVAFTDRHGGVSEGSFSSLNLAGSGGDDTAAVEVNLDRVAAAFTRATADGAGRPLVVGLHQVHGADVHVVGGEPAGGRAGGRDGAHAGGGRGVLVGDGLVTAEPGVVLMVRAADCVPVLLADVDAGVVGAAHAGRPGMVAGVVPATVGRMRDLGARRIVAWVGPHVCGACYEVPEEMRADVAAVVPEAYATTSWGTPAVDVGAGVRAQLRRDEVEIVAVDRCTIEDEDLFSYRRQGRASGRMAGLVRVRP